MASWRPPGSILEAPGLDFGGSGPHFRKLWTSYLEPRTPRTPESELGVDVEGFAHAGNRFGGTNL